MKKLAMALLFASTTIGFYSCESSSASSSTSSTIKGEEKIVTAYAKSNSNLEEEITIAHQRDEIEGKDYYSVSKPLMVRDGKEGFSIMVSFKNKQGKIVYNGILVNAEKVGTCQEDGILYILFQDGTKKQMKQWNDFNCNGNVFLDLDRSELNKLNKPIKALKLVNGRDFTSFEKTFTENRDINYFINVIKALEAQKITEVEELPTY